MSKLVSLTFPVSGVYIFESRHDRSFAQDLHHHDWPQAFFVLNGKGQVQLGSDRHELAAGALVLMDSGVPHRLEDDPSEPLSLYVLAFRTDAISTLAARGRFMDDLFRPKYRLFAPGSFDEVRIRSELRRLLHEQATQAPDHEVASLLHVVAVLVSLHRAAQPARNAVSRKDSRVAAACRYMEERFFEALSVEEVATAVRCSSRRLSQLFRAEMGESVVEYLTRLRVTRAQELLTDSALDIASICFEVGYENLSHFYRVFKQATGYTPKQYRDRHQVK